MSAPSVLETPVLVTEIELRSDPVPVFHWIHATFTSSSICGATQGRRAVQTRTSTVSTAGRPCDRCLRILGRLA